MNYGLTIETNNFVFEGKFILGLESTRPDGCMGGWINGKYSHLSPAGAEVWAEFGNRGV